MSIFAMLAFSAGNSGINHYPLTLDSTDNVASANVWKPDLFASYAHPVPDVKVVHAAVLDVNYYLVLSRDWIWKILILQNVQRPVLGKRDCLHTRLCISFRSFAKCASSAGTGMLIGSLSERGLPSFIVSFFLFQTIELKSVICFV